MLPNDRLGKNRLPVCPRGQIPDVLEPLAATTARRTRVGTDAEASTSGVVALEIEAHARAQERAAFAPCIAAERARVSLSSLMRPSQADRWCHLSRKSACRSMRRGSP